MMHRIRTIRIGVLSMGLIAMVGIIALAALPALAANPKNPSLLNVAQLKNPPALGNGINMGGFSALTHLPDDPANVFYTMTDR